MSSAPFILVIDFEPRSLAKTRAALELAGFAVRSAANGKELREIIETQSPALVLMEPMLPGQDGFKLCQAIKQRAQGRPLTVIVASRIYRGARYRNMAKEAGADAYFERPSQDAQIMAIVERVVARIENGPTSASAPVGSAPLFTSGIISATPLTTQPRPTTPITHAPSPAPPAVQLPTVASASALSRAVVASSSAAASADLKDLSDGDIDDALSRALGASFESPTIPTPSPVVPRTQFVGHTSVSAPEEDPFDFDFGSTSDPSASVDLDALGLALDEIELPEIPVAQVARRSHEEDLGFVLLPEKDAAAAKRPPSAPLQFNENEYSLDVATLKKEAHASDAVGETTPPVAVAPSSELQGLDDFFEQNFRPIEPDAATASAGDVVSAPIPPRFDDTPRGFSGEVLGDPALDPEPGPNTGPPPFASGANEVPANLRGMDRGTAELLSSLEELESSLPQSENGHSSGWNEGSEFEGSLSSLSSLNSFSPLDNSSSGVVHERPPASAEEQSLEEMLARITSDDQPTGRSMVSKPQVADEVLPSSPVLAESARDDDFDIDFGFDPVPAPPKSTPATASASLPLSGPVNAALSFQVVPAAESLLDHREAEPLAPLEPIRRPTRAARSHEPPTPSRAWGLSSVLWYALIGVVLGAVALYVVSTFFASDDMGAQAEPSPRAPVVERPQGPAAVPAPEVESKNARSTRPTAKKQTPTAPGSASRTPAVDPKPLTNKSPETKPVATVTPQLTQEAPIATPAEAPPAQRPTPTTTSATGERERPQPVLAAPQVSDPPLTFATGPGFAEPARLVRLADLDEPLRLLESPRPETPPEALQAGVSGRVFLSVLVGDDGEVKDTKIMIEPGYGMGEAARHATRGWRYSRPKSRGEAARVWKTEVLEFDGQGRSVGTADGGTEPESAQSP